MCGWCIGGFGVHEVCLWGLLVCASYWSPSIGHQKPVQSWTVMSLFAQVRVQPAKGSHHQERCDGDIGLIVGLVVQARMCVGTSSGPNFGF